VTWFVVLMALASAPADGSAARPLDLRSAIVEALAARPRLRPADDRVSLAAIQQAQAAARFGTRVAPSFAAGTDPAGVEQRNLGISVTRRLPFGTTVSASATSFQYGAGGSAIRDAGYTIELSQPLLNGFRETATADLAAARLAVDAAGHGRAIARQQLVIDVAAAFLAAVRARRLVEAGTRAVDRAATLEAASRARARVGLATELDVLRAGLLGSQARAALADNRETLESSLDTLKVLIGRPLDAPLALADIDLSDTAIASLGLAPDLPRADAGDADAAIDRLVRDALAARDDVQEARERMADGARAERVARWNLRPPVVLDVSYTRRGLGSPAADPFGALLSGWRFGVTTNYQIDRADERAAAASAAVTAAAAVRASAETDRAVAMEVRRAYRAWARTADTVAIQRASVDLADKQRRVASLRYERGLASSLDVVDAENALFQAQSALVGAEVERVLGGLVLERVAGRLRPDAFAP
jgi:outer membrane protein TolC